jgi:hypothetical protein
MRRAQAGKKTATLEQIAAFNYLACHDRCTVESTATLCALHPDK